MAQTASVLDSSGSTDLTDGNQTQGDKVWDFANKILNPDSMNVDSEKGIFTWHNSKFDMGTNLPVRSLFERYLSSPGYPDTGQTYQQVLTQIHDLLANDPGLNGTLTAAQVNERVYQAWQLLSDAAKYPEDGGASETLANQVFNAWRVRDELTANRAQYAALQNKEKLQQKDVASDSTAVAIEQEGAAKTAGGQVYTNYMAGQALGQQGAQSVAGSAGAGDPGTANITNGSSGNRSNSGSLINIGNTTNNPSSLLNGTANQGPGVSSVQGAPSQNNTDGGGYGDDTNLANKPTGVGTTMNGIHARDLARTYVQESLLDADATTMGVQAKLQFQTQLLGFVGQRRFQHSLLAGQFYEHIFKGSEQRMNLAQDEISRYMNTNSVVPSVNNFEFMSHEAIAEVESSMKAVNAAYDTGDRWTALQQLEQAFLLGEHLPPVQDFDPAKRKVLLNIYREAVELGHTMEIRDFARAEETLKNIQAEAKDFEAAPVLSAVKEAEQTSNNYVLAAGQAAMTGDTDRVTASLQKATMIWPLNPEISNFSKTMLDRTNLKNVGGEKFDELLAQGNDRAIYDARDEIGLAVYQDPDRSAKLKAILSRMGQVEMAIAFADQAMKQNNGYAAWETLQSAADLEPNDPVLARSMRNVAPRVPNFVAALDSADRATKSGDYAAALNYYLEAQDLYPASRICSDAIADLSAKLMAKLNPAGPTAKSLAQKQSVQSAVGPNPDSAPTTANPPESKPVAKTDTNS